MKKPIPNLNKNLAYNKAESIIKSCINCNQLMMAERYIEIYCNRFNDTSGYNELYEMLVEKRQELNCVIIPNYE